MKDRVFTGSSSRLLPLGLALLLLVALPLAACGDDGETDTTAPASTAATAGTATTGEAVTTDAPAGTDTTGTSGEGTDAAALYEDECASCHGQSGEGGVGPAFQGNTALREEQAEQTIRSGGGGMPPFEGQLTDEQISSLASYVVEDLAAQ
jgi:cytochrome c551